MNTDGNIYEVSRCSSSLLFGLQQQSVYFSAVNIFLSITAFLGNFLILVALNKESSLHPPSKLLYRCLTTTDLLVGLVSQPLASTYWMSVVHEHRSLCLHAMDAIYISSYALCGVSLLTLTAKSADRLLALWLGIRYRQIVTLKRTYIITATFWIFFRRCWIIFHFTYSNNQLVYYYSYTVMLSDLNRLVHKDILHS